MRFRSYCWRAMLLQCPSCGRGTLVRGPLRIHDRCRECGLYFVHDDGFWLGAWHFNFFIASLLAIVPAMVGVATGAWSTIFALLYAAAISILFPILFYWHSYSFWIATYYYCVPDDLRMGRDHLQRRSTAELKALLSEAELERFWAEEGARELEGDKLVHR